MKPLILIFYDNYAIIYKIINYDFQYKGTNMKKKKTNNNNLAIAYYRYSSHAQNETSIDQQREAAQKYAEEHGFQIIREYCDEALSGTAVEDRVQFRLMLSEVGKLHPAALIVWKTDRIARNRVDSALAKKAIRDSGCEIHYVAEAMPKDAPEAALMEGLLESMAEFYSKQLKQNIVRGMRYNAENCYYNGHKMLGYKPEEGKKANKKILIDPDTAPIVQRIFAEYAAGKQLQIIANELNEQGFRTVLGKQFTINSLRHILHNEAYIGTYKYADIIVKNGIPAIVSEELFEKVQSMFELNKRVSVHMTSEQASYGPPRYWLTGKLFCGYCGNSMQGVSGTSKTGKKHYYYYCSGQRKHQCNKSPIRQDIVENIVKHAIYDILANSDNSIRIADEASYYYSTHYNDTSYIDSMKAELKNVENSLNNLVKAIEQGIFSETTMQRLTELENQKKLIENSIEIETAKQEVMADRHSIESYFHMFNDPESFLFDPTVRDAALEYFIDKIYVYDDKVVITGTFCDYEDDSGIYEVSLDELNYDVEFNSLDIEFNPFAVESTKPKLCEHSSA